MSSAIPPAPPPVAPLPQLSPSAVLSVVADAGSGAALAKLQLGSILSAALTTASTAGDGKAVIQVMTADGTNLSLRLPPGLPIPDGAQLAMQFISQNGLPAFKLLSVNGRPLPGLSLGNAQLPLAANTPDLLASLGGGAGAKPQAGSAAIQPGAPAVVQASPGLVAGPPGLMATVIRSAPPGAVMMAPNPGAPGFDAEAKLPTSLANLPAGAQLSVRIAAVALPAQGGLGAGQAIPTSLAGPAASPGVAASAAPLAAAASAGLEPAPLANAASPQAGRPRPAVAGRAARQGAGGRGTPARHLPYEGRKQRV
ncbi:MAG: DNA polymerase III, partial [Magnetospirillum sp.]|nr:DNA polymerase III [Magnetospirillum sp.]